MNELSFLREIFDAAVRAAQPADAVGRIQLERPSGHRVVLAAGKAAAGMAAAFVERFGPPARLLVVTRDGHAAGAPVGADLLFGGHPLPDERSAAAGRAALSLAGGLGEDDQLVVLLSGGASSLLTCPVTNASVSAVRTVIEALLASGAAIGEVNTVRRHLSCVHGGRLAAAAFPAETRGFAISDVPGDDVAAIGSGPATGDPTTVADALNVARRFTPGLEAFLSAAMEETPKPGATRLARADTQVIASAAQALARGARVAQSCGYEVLDLGVRLQADAHDLGREHARLVRALAEARRRLVVLSGGETSVVVRNRGRGGRNKAYLLALALALRGQPGVWALAADTDGIDGTEDDAGAWIGPDTLVRAAELGLSAAASLEANNSYDFFAALQSLVLTGPTGTNVNDLRAILIDPDATVTR